MRVLVSVNLGKGERYYTLLRYNNGRVIVKDGSNIRSFPKNKIINKKVERLQTIKVINDEVYI